MITYKIDKEKKYLDDLLVDLRAHNKSHTGEKTKETKHIYCVKNDQLLGSIKATLSWDWIGLGDIYYKDTEVLKDLLWKVANSFKDYVGIKAISEMEERHNDFIVAGMTHRAVVKGTPKTTDTYFADLIDSTLQPSNKYHMLSSDSPIHEYDAFVQKNVQKYNEKHNINNKPEVILYVALDGDTFAGGIQIEINKDSMYIDLLAVNKKYRGNDIGTKLMDYVEELARERKLHSINLGTTEFQARPFYEKQGYHVILTRENFPRGFECYTLLKILNYKE